MPSQIMSMDLLPFYTFLSHLNLSLNSQRHLWLFVACAALYVHSKKWTCGEFCREQIIHYKGNSMKNKSIHCQMNLVSWVSINSILIKLSGLEQITLYPSLCHTTSHIHIQHDGAILLDSPLQPWADFGVSRPESSSSQVWNLRSTYYCCDFFWSSMKMAEFYSVM